MLLRKSMIILGLASLVARTSFLGLMQPVQAITIAQNTASSCASGSLYTFKSGDTLFLVAQNQLGDENRWHEIKKADGSAFTDEEVSNLQPGQGICIPASKSESKPNSSPSLRKGNFKKMLEALGAFESGLPSGNPNQYKVENSLGFMGKYQFGEPLLIDLGYYKANTFYGNGADKNYWRGTWTGKNGISSKEQFQNSPTVQELAIREAFKLNWERVNSALTAKGQSIDSYLGKQKTFTDKGTSKTIKISLSGVLAGAHLRGPYGVANLLLNNEVSHDEYGTSILRYMEEYGGYNVKVADFSGAKTQITSNKSLKEVTTSEESDANDAESNTDDAESNTNDVESNTDNSESNTDCTEPNTDTTESNVDDTESKAYRVNTDDTNSIEQSVFNQINQYRVSKGLTPLSRDARIDRQAKIHSRNMATGKTSFGHDGFSERIKDVGVSNRTSAENIAKNRGSRDSASVAVQGWLKSPGHLKNIQNQDFNLTGIGVEINSKGKVYLTQIFLHSR
jgi:uncharacterized protein YkwD